MFCKNCKTYLEGVKECEAMYNNGVTLDELTQYIERETIIGGYLWVDWADGFCDCIGHLERLEGLGLV